MTVESITNRAQYATNGTTGPFTVPFYFLADGDLQVIHTDSDGNETTLTLTTWRNGGRMIVDDNPALEVQR